MAARVEAVFRPCSAMRWPGEASGAVDVGRDSIELPIGVVVASVEQRSFCLGDGGRPAGALELAISCRDRGSLGGGSVVFVGRASDQAVVGRQGLRRE